MTKIQVIIGSTRPGRFGPTAAQAFIKVAQEMNLDGVEFELVDLKDINLPMLDESNSASQNKYTNQHTKDWAAKVAQADGYVFVTSEYNHSYPASLKNAIDYLYKEWNHKPVAFVGYGALLGGGRAIEHLRTIAAQIKMFDIHETVTISNYWEQIDDNGFNLTKEQVKASQDLAKSIAFWSEELKTPRAKLTQGK